MEVDAPVDFNLLFNNRQMLKPKKYKDILQSLVVIFADQRNAVLKQLKLRPAPLQQTPLSKKQKTTE